MTDGEEINEGKKKRRGKKKDENPFPLSPSVLSHINDVVPMRNVLVAVP